MATVAPTAAVPNPARAPPSSIRRDREGGVLASAAGALFPSSASRRLSLMTPPTLLAGITTAGAAIVNGTVEAMSAKVQLGVIARDPEAEKLIRRSAAVLAHPQGEHLAPARCWHILRRTQTEAMPSFGEKVAFDRDAQLAERMHPAEAVPGEH